MNLVRLLAIVLLVSPIAHSQENGMVDSSHPIRVVLASKSISVAREAGSAARDFARFRDPQWSMLTLAQIGAASADAVTSLNNLHECSSCWESGPSRFFVGRHPDAHKYVLAGAIEIGIEAVSAHYFRNHGPIRKWYWRALWELPQSVSLYEHTRAAYHNAAMNLGCFTSGPGCR